MNKKHSIFTLIIPTLGALLLLGWSLGYPLVASITSGDLSDFPDSVIFGHVYIQMFGLPAWVWVIGALGCFGSGLWLVLNAVHEHAFKGAQVLGLILAMVPSFIVGLGPFFAEYHGP